jgi:Asp-tRNA(Asn)/Glu-tRNA(Gln) amidotransferase A subunit family amidase
MKVIISQPMKGKPEAQIREERAALVAKIEKAGHTVADTIFPDFKDEGNIPLKYLSKSLEAIAEADAVVFMDGWENTRGCRIEHRCCEDYGTRILDPRFFDGVRGRGMDQESPRG